MACARGLLETPHDRHVVTWPQCFNYVTVHRTRPLRLVRSQIPPNRGDLMPDRDKLLAWIEPRTSDEFIAAFVAAPLAAERAPATQRVVTRRCTAMGRGAGSRPWCCHQVGRRAPKGLERYRAEWVVPIAHHVIARRRSRRSNPHQGWPRTAIASSAEPRRCAPHIWAMRSRRLRTSTGLPPQAPQACASTIPPRPPGQARGV